MPKGNPKGAGIGKYVPKNKFQINEEKYDEKDNSEVDERDDWRWELVSDGGNNILVEPNIFIVGS